MLLYHFLLAEIINCLLLIWRVQWRDVGGVYFIYLFIINGGDVCPCLSLACGGHRGSVASLRSLGLFSCTFIDPVVWFWWLCGQRRPCWSRSGPKAFESQLQTQNGGGLAPRPGSVTPQCRTPCSLHLHPLVAWRSEGSCTLSQTFICKKKKKSELFTAAAQALHLLLEVRSNVLQEDLFKANISRRHKPDSPLDFTHFSYNIN